MSIKKVSLSWISVNDTKRAKDFFTKTLGLKVFEESEDRQWLEIGAHDPKAVLGICKAAPEYHMPAGMNAVITLLTDQYDKTKKELSQKGIQFFGEVSGIPNVPRMITFKDPDGNLFQLVEETPNLTETLN